MQAAPTFEAVLIGRHEDVDRVQRQLTVHAPVVGTTDEAITACVDERRAHRYHELCHVPGLHARDHLARLLEAPDGRMAIAELRFRGLDLDQPFVELRATNFGLAPRHVADLLPAVSAAFRRAEPRWLRAYLTAEQEADGARWDVLPWHPDLRLVAAPLGELRSRPLPPRYDQLGLRRYDPGRHDDYTRCCAHADGETPHPLATLARLGAAQIAWDAYVDGAWAGLIAFESRPFAGDSAFEVVEQRLVPALRGRGLGPVLQRHAIERTAGDAILFGTIRWDNVASLRTARRVGRSELGGFRWFALPP